MELTGNCLPISGHLEPQKNQKINIGLGVLERPKINRCAATIKCKSNNGPPQTSIWRQSKRAALLAHVQVRLAFGPVKADRPAAVRAVKRNRLVVHHGLG
jgi:hypothetical protein